MGKGICARWSDECATYRATDTSIGGFRLGHIGIRADLELEAFHWVQRIIKSSYSRMEWQEEIKLTVMDGERTFD